LKFISYMVIQNKQVFYFITLCSLRSLWLAAVFMFIQSVIRHYEHERRIG